jgi:hypothetical protein
METKLATLKKDFLENYRFGCSVDLLPSLSHFLFLRFDLFHVLVGSVGTHGQDKARGLLVSNRIG